MGLLSGIKHFNKDFFGLGKVRFFIGGGGRVGRGVLELFCQKRRSPPTSWNGLMHDPSKIPKQKHLTLPHPPQPIQDKNNRKWK